MKLVWVSVVSACLCLALLAYTSVLRARDVRAIERVAVETNHALCALRHDLESRYVNGVEFLERNPNGIPGISPQDITRSLESQRSTLAALKSLPCE